MNSEGRQGHAPRPRRENDASNYPAQVAVSTEAVTVAIGPFTSIVSNHSGWSGAPEPTPWHCTRCEAPLRERPAHCPRCGSSMIAHGPVPEVRFSTGPRPLRDYPLPPRATEAPRGRRRQSRRRRQVGSNRRRRHVVGTS